MLIFSHFEDTVVGFSASLLKMFFTAFSGYYGSLYYVIIRGLRIVFVV